MCHIRESGVAISLSLAKALLPNNSPTINSFLGITASSNKPHGALFKGKDNCRIIAIEHYFPSLKTKKQKGT